MKKFLKWAAIILVVVIGGLVIYIQTSWKKTYDAPYPEITVSTDSAVIERGAYLAYGLAHCAVCHVPQDKLDLVKAGERIPLSGGWEITIPPGTFRAPNITPDPETGIGNMTDAELARVLRHMVKPDNTVVLPFMPFSGISEDDLVAIVSFLRSQPPVVHKVPDNEFTFLGKAVMAFGLIKPAGPKETPPKSVKRDSTVEYGRYLANYVGDCIGCHTERDLKTGEFLGKPFAGGGTFDEKGAAHIYISPNLTPDQNSGQMTTWSESQFVNRFRGGRVYADSPMPWELFSRVDDVELKAIYKYLMSLDPVYNKIDKIVVDR